MAKRKRRPCPRGLYDGCPIPRELCTGDYERTGVWHCLEFLRDFEWFLFETEGVEEQAGGGEGEIESLEELMRALEEDGGQV